MPATESVANETNSQRSPRGTDQEIGKGKRQGVEPERKGGLRRRESSYVDGVPIGHQKSQPDALQPRGSTRYRGMHGPVPENLLPPLAVMSTFVSISDIGRTGQRKSCDQL